MTTIANRQDQPAQIRLLRSRRQTYYQAKWILAAQLFATILVPIVGSLVSIFDPRAAPYTAALGLIIIVADTAFLDRPLQRRLLMAARLAEMFDTKVLCLPWNPTFAGAQVDAETLNGLEAGFQRRGQGDGKIQGWYPGGADRTDLHLGRILCQLANPWYDGSLRKVYAKVILASSLIVGLSLFLFGIWMDLTVPQFCGSVLATLTPLFSWSLREYFRQSDTAERTDEIRSVLFEFWNDARRREVGEVECARRSRSIQDAIFVHRAIAPLAIPFVYSFVRSSMEEQMHAAVEERLAEILPPPPNGSGDVA